MKMHDSTSHIEILNLNEAGKVDSMNSLNNQSKVEDADGPFSWEWKIILATSMVVLIVMAVFGNVMVILIVLRRKGMRTRTNMFIVNLAVADALVAILDMPFSLTVVIQGRWYPMSDALCSFNAFTMALFLIASIHTMMYIAIHKYISITRPFSHFMTPKRILLMIFAVWAWAGFIAASLFFWTESRYKPGSTQCGPVIPETKLSKIHSYMVTTTCFIIPLVIMTFCYWSIFLEIGRHSERLKIHAGFDPEHVLDQQTRITKTLVLVLVCFVLCYMPYFIYSNYLSVGRHALIPLWGALAYWCGYANSVCNPLIYAWRSPSFRQGYLEILCRRKYTHSVRDESTIPSSIRKFTRRLTRRAHGSHTSKSNAKRRIHQSERRRTSTSPNPHVQNFRRSSMPELWRTELEQSVGQLPPNKSSYSAKHNLTTQTSEVVEQSANRSQDVGNDNAFNEKVKEYIEDGLKSESEHETVRSTKAAPLGAGAQETHLTSRQESPSKNASPSDEKVGISRTAPFTKEQVEKPSKSSMQVSPIHRQMAHITMADAQLFNVHVLPVAKSDVKQNSTEATNSGKCKPEQVTNRTNIH